MTLLIIGLALWVGAHFFKRLAPNAREQIVVRFGAGASRGIMAGLMVLGIVLMVLGYRNAEYSPVYEPMTHLRHVTILLVFLAVVLLGMGSSKGRARTWLRHPMLTGVVVWAGAHLLMRGDLAAVVLFGGLALWAIAEMFIINAAQGKWMRPKAGPAKGDIKLIIISVVVFTVLAGLHVVLGPNPFAGG